MKVEEGYRAIARAFPHFTKPAKSLLSMTKEEAIKACATMYMTTDGTQPL